MGEEKEGEGEGEGDGKQEELEDTRTEAEKRFAEAKRKKVCRGTGTRASWHGDGSTSLTVYRHVVVAGDVQVGDAAPGAAQDAQGAGRGAEQPPVATQRASRHAQDRARLGILQCGGREGQVRSLGTSGLGNQSLQRLVVDPVKRRKQKRMRVECTSLRFFKQSITFIRLFLSSPPPRNDGGVEECPESCTCSPRGPRSMFHARRHENDPVFSERHASRSVHKTRIGEEKKGGLFAIFDAAQPDFVGLNTPANERLQRRRAIRKTGRPLSTLTRHWSATSLARWSPTGWHSWGQR